jgi:hypothetical protein
VLSHGQFGKWLDVEFGWSERTVRNFMGVAQRFGKSAKFADLQIQPSAAYLLAAPSALDEARRTALEMAFEGEQITTKMARKIVANARKRKTIFGVCPSARSALANASEWPGSTSATVSDKRASRYLRILGLAATSANCATSFASSTVTFSWSAVWRGSRRGNSSSSTFNRGGKVISEAIATRRYEAICQPTLSRYWYDHELGKKSTAAPVLARHGAWVVLANR